MEMSLGKKVANALSFAHLAKIGSNAKAKSEDDDKKDDGERDHEDGGVKKGNKAEDKKDDEYAEDDDTDAKASDDGQTDSEDGDNEDGGDKKGKKAKADDDEDKDEEMRGNSVAAAARRREQARCATIFGSTAAARNPVLAANLAFKTRMSRDEALAVLEATPSAAQNNLSRANRNPNVGAGASSSMTSQQAVASGWDRAFAKANPLRK